MILKGDNEGKSAKLKVNRHIKIRKDKRKKKTKLGEITEPKCYAVIWQGNADGEV